MPMPLSEMVRVFFSRSMRMLIRASAPSLQSPAMAAMRRLLMASTPLLTSSRRNTSWPLYTAFLMIGKMFSVWI